MTKYPDGSILILPDEKIGLELLLRGYANNEHYLNVNISKFIAKWNELNIGCMDRESMVFEK